MGGVYLRDLKFQTGSSHQALSQRCRNIFLDEVTAQISTNKTLLLESWII